MKQFFCCFCILLSSIFCKAQSSYEASLKEIGNACDNYSSKEDFNEHFCKLYQNTKKEISKKGESFKKNFLEYVPFPNSVAMTGIFLKALIDRKIEIDPHLNNYGRPRLEIKPEEVRFKVSYEFN